MEEVEEDAGMEEVMGGKGEDTMDDLMDWLSLQTVVPVLQTEL
jgi:hypothetical protein